MEKIFYSLIEDIYSSPGSIDGWNRSLSSIIGNLGAKAGAYMMVNSETLQPDISIGYCYEKADLEEYKKIGIKDDVRLKYANNLLPGKVYREFEFVPDRKSYDESKWIQYMQIKYGIYWGLAGHVSTHGLWKDVISMNRSKDLGPHTEEQKNTLQLLLPHLARAAELHRTFTSLKSRYGAVLSVLDKLLIGLVVLDTELRVAASNTTSRRISEKTGVFKITRDGKFVANNQNQQSEVLNILKHAINTVTGAGSHDGGQLHLCRGQDHVLLEIMPLRDDGLPDCDNILGAAVFIIDPSVAEQISLTGIAKIFSLSTAERAVAESLVNGVSIRDIADMRNTTLDTIRKQLKSVYRKSGVNSQLDLLRLATKANPPIDCN